MLLPPRVNNNAQLPMAPYNQLNNYNLNNKNKQNKNNDNQSVPIVPSYNQLNNSNLNIKNKENKENQNNNNQSLSFSQMPVFLHGGAVLSNLVNRENGVDAANYPSNAYYDAKIANDNQKVGGKIANGVKYQSLPSNYYVSTRCSNDIDDWDDHPYLEDDFDDDDDDIEMNL